MAYTKFGEILRILRIKNHEVMGDVAKLLKVSTPFLSAVETGKKNVPPEWFEILADHYSLNNSEIAKMKEAASVSKNQMKISLYRSDAFKREVALQFARSFEGIDEETAAKILALLKNCGNN